MAGAGRGLLHRPDGLGLATMSAKDREELRMHAAAIGNASRNREAMRLVSQHSVDTLLDMTTPLSLKEIVAAIEDHKDATSVETPLHDLLRTVLCEREFTFGKLSKFVTGTNLTVDFHETSDKALYFQSIVIYGEMTYGERKDAGAKVTITATGAYITAQDYGVSGYRALPEGARQKLAHLVRDEYTSAFPQFDMQALAVEAQAIDKLYKYRSNLAQAVRNLEVAIRDGVPS